jgi:uncharacterized protein (TIGR03435 family)
MHELDDNTLLRQYAEQNSEAAFAALVARHVDKVYSVALRHTRNAHAAEEITQAVFVILAKKSGRLGGKVILSGWLYETARLTALTYIRSEIRRARREQEAHMQTALNENESEAWPHIAPLLDDALAGLSAADRHAVVLRYFDGKSLGEVGAALGASEDAAKKRVTRAVEKLRGFFTKRGVTLTATILTAAISANSVQAAPLGLATTVAAAAAKGAAVSGSTLTLIKGALKIMAWTKMETAIVVTVGVLLAAGTATVVVKEAKGLQTYSWQVPKADFKVLYEAPKQVRIVPAKYPAADRDSCSESTKENIKVLGISETVRGIVCAAYDGQPSRVVFLTTEPQSKYDFIANLSSGSADALQHEIKKQFGFTARKEIRETEVLLLKVKVPISKNLKVSASENKKEWGMRVSGSGNFGLVHEPISWLNRYLEQKLKMPVLDRTGLNGNYDLAVEWDEPDWHKPNPDGLKQALKDQLGLELVPSREPVEMLVVEKVK